MRTIRTKVYKFDELSKEAKAVAIENNRYINVISDWSEFICQDAENVGISILGLDLGIGDYCDVRIIDADQTANTIVYEHGEDCLTYSAAKRYNDSKETILNDAAKDSNGDFEDEDEVDELLREAELNLNIDLSREYLTMLKNEYEHLTSDEAIIETIRANEYEFTQDGRQF